jgi:protein SCO1/2
MFQIPPDQSFLSYCGALAADLLAAAGPVTWIAAGLGFVVLLVGFVVVGSPDRSSHGDARSGPTARIFTAVMARLHLDVLVGRLANSRLAGRGDAVFMGFLVCAFVTSVAIAGWTLATAITSPEQRKAGTAVAARLGGPFALTDHSGRPVTDQTFRGRYMLLAFGYTFCPDVCPTILNTVAETLDRLGDQATQVAPLFITIDPGRDTRVVLRGYVGAFHPAIIGLTGSEAQVRAVAEAYNVNYQRAGTSATSDDDAYLMNHTTLIYLVGRDGRFLRFFRHTATPMEITGAILAFAAEPKS